MSNLIIFSTGIRLTIRTGELFLGQPSGGLDALVTPSLLEDIDEAFMIGALKGTVPWLLPLLNALPVKALRKYLDAGQRVMQVCKDLASERQTSD